MRSHEDILRESATIAVVGLSPDPDRDSHDVARYLQAQGYRIIPVNPEVDEVLGERCYPDLASVPGPIDLVDVFRRAEAAPEIARQAAAVGAKALWLQLGVVSEEAARLAQAAGLDVVMDACTMRDHAQLRAQGRL